jgi:rod shape-determining protein MreC
VSIADKAKDKAKRNPNWLLGALLGLHIIVISFNRSPERPELWVLQTVLMTAMAPVQAGLTHSGNWVSDRWKSYLYLRGVREENERLKSELTRSAGELGTLREELVDYRQLRRLLEGSSLPGGTDAYQKVFARVIGRDANHLFATVVIDKGSIHGIKKDQPVVDATGLVGRVVVVTPLASRVVLVTDERHGAGVVIATTAAGRLLAVVRGVRDNYYFQLDFITPPVKIENGESVVTSGQDGIYPPGLLIGRVANPTDQPVSTQQRLVIAPAADLGRLEVVSVLQVTRDQIRAGLEAVANEEAQQDALSTKKKPNQK